MPSSDILLSLRQKGILQLLPHICLFLLTLFPGLNRMQFHDIFLVSLNKVVVFLEPIRPIAAEGTTVHHVQSECYAGYDLLYFSKLVCLFSVERGWNSLRVSLQTNLSRLGRMQVWFILLQQSCIDSVTIQYQRLIKVTRQDNLSTLVGQEKSFDRTYIRILQKNKTMSLQQAQRYSIKTKLQEKLALQKQSLSSTPVTIQQGKIYMPEYHNYFLHTIEKEIKHEGNLLRRIKRKIEDFKEKKVEKRRIKNSKHYYSHLMFSPNSLKKSKDKASPFEELQQKYMASAATQQRHTVQVNSSSPSNKLLQENRVRTACQTRGSSTAQSVFNPSRTSVYQQAELVQKFSKLVKQGRRRENDEFTVLGGRPQWSAFESYRNNSGYRLKMQ